MITHENLSKFIFQKFVLFINFDDSSNDRIQIELLYFINEDDMTFKSFEIKGHKKMWFTIFKKLFSKISEIGKIINAKKRKFFRDSINIFDTIMRHSVKKGTLYGLYRKFNYYLNTLSVYGYNFQESFNNYLLCTAHILNEKSKTKSLVIN